MARSEYIFILCFASTKFISTRMRSKTKQFVFIRQFCLNRYKYCQKKAKMTVYYCGLFLDSILSKSAGISICCIYCSQGCYSNIILTLTISIWLIYIKSYKLLKQLPNEFRNSFSRDTVNLKLLWMKFLI